MTLQQRLSNVQKLKSLQESIEALDKYCRKNKLHEDWLYSWVDVQRQSRDGLFNTNDFTEALLITVLVETVFPYYEDLVALADEGIPTEIKEHVSDHAD